MAQKALDVDDLICRLLNVGSPGCSLTKTVKEQEFINLCAVSREVFLSQNSLIEIDPPVRICGDTHGQYADLLRLFDRGGFPPYVNYLFLGDYVDRGRQNLETISLLLCYKVKYPENFFLLRGNHECSVINRVYGFFEECNRRYQSVRLWQTFQEVFNTMPFTGKYHLLKISIFINRPKTSCAKNRFEHAMRRGKCQASCQPTELIS